MDSIQQALYQWTADYFKEHSIPWEGITGDASARRYFRTEHDGKFYLAVDSPITEVDNAQFIELAKGLAKAGLNVPTVYAVDLDKGFLLVNEISRELYADVLTPENANDLYGDAISALIQLQNSKKYFDVPIEPWKPADYYEEMTDMIQWLFGRHLNLILEPYQQQSLEKLFSDLIENMQDQPQVCVHRDYHSRNLLYCTHHNPGIIDFQDLFLGPVTYDLVSLVRDAYIEWPWEDVERWVNQFYKDLTEQPEFQTINEKQFNEWFHGMVLQRGIKVLGRFARLCHRDKKTRYLADLPRVAKYVINSCPYFPGTEVLLEILKEQVMPGLAVVGE